MKKLILSILIVLAFASSSWAIVTYNCNYLTGGDTRALDYLSVNDLSDGDRAIVIIPSTNEYLYFKYDNSGTTAEQTTAHPYYVRPNDYVTRGVWYECSVKWVSLNSDISANNIVAAGTITGKIFVINLISSETISGASLYGGWVGNYGIASEVTATLPAVQDGMNIAFHLRQSNQNIAIKLNAGDTLLGISNFSSGSSVILLNGSSMSAYAVLTYCYPTVWCLSGGSCSTRNQ